MTVFFAAFCYGCAENLMFSVVGAGLKRPPARKSDFVVCCSEIQNYGFIKDASFFVPHSVRAGAETRPYNYRFYFFCAAAALCKIYLRHGKATAKDGRNG